MRSICIATTLLAFAAACGSVQSQPDASEGSVDAPAGTIDAPAGTIDAPEGTIDAPISIDAATDAAIDAIPIDAPPPTVPFDIAYSSRWNIINTTGVGASQLGLIVNKSTTGQAMDLNTLSVVSSSDDNAQAVFTFMILNPATYSLPA